MALPPSPYRDALEALAALRRLRCCGWLEYQ